MKYNKKNNQFNNIKKEACHTENIGRVPYEGMTAFDMQNLSDKDFIQAWEDIFGETESFKRLKAQKSFYRERNDVANDSEYQTKFFTRNQSTYQKECLSEEKYSILSTGYVGQTKQSDHRSPQDKDNDFWSRHHKINNKKKPIRYQKIKKVLISLLVVVVLYIFLVFSNIPFIAKWRTIYIETAMSTMNHQWLATAFLPQSVIDKVMLERINLEESQSGLESYWDISGFSKRDLYQPWKKTQKNFSKIYSEIDQKSFNDYIEEHSGEFINEEGFLVIDKAGLKDKGTSIKTVYGDQVLAIDTKNAISIIKVTGDDYVGRLAIVKDPSRVGVGLSEDFGKKGALIEDIAKYNDAVLAINASGFYDPAGHGNGGRVFGLVIKDGKILNGALGNKNKIVGFNRRDKLNIGGSNSLSSYRDAVEFKPVLIINGEVLVTGTAGWGIQPRSAIGQTKNGEVLLLIIDGRSPGYSIGSSLGELAEIMKRYGAHQAINLDGGSSSIMYYNGREISKPSAANKIKGRNIPNGFVVDNK